jgi:hypothetical protein
MTLTLRHKTGHHIQIVNDPLRIAVSQKNLAIRRSDVNHPVSPDVGAGAADTANPIPAQETPGFDRVAYDRLLRNRAQPESQRPDLDPVLQEAVLEAAPRHQERAQPDHADYPQSEAAGRGRNENHR